MTAGPSSRERAAAAVLGVPPDAPLAAVRAALLRKLPAEGFVPPEEWTAAANVLAGAALPLSADAKATAAEAFLPDVEAFAAVYWSLPPAERRARWADLKVRCPGEPAAGRLRQLEAGLDVSGAPHPDAGAEEVAALVRELFLLPPRARAVRRAEWLVGQAGRFQERVAAARLVLRDALPLARLDPRLFDWFAEGKPLQTVDSPSEESHDEYAPPRPSQAPVYESEDYWTRRDVRNAKWITRGAVVLAIASAIGFRIMMSVRNDRPGPSRPATPWVDPTPYAPPRPAPYTNPEPHLPFTPTQLEAFRQYERTRVGPEPEGYTLFRLTGGQILETGPGGTRSTKW